MSSRTFRKVAYRFFAGQVCFSGRLFRNISSNTLVFIRDWLRKLVPEWANRKSSMSNINSDPRMTLALWAPNMVLEWAQWHRKHFGDQIHSRKIDVKRRVQKYSEVQVNRTDIKSYGIQVCQLVFHRCDHQLPRPPLWALSCDADDPGNHQTHSHEPCDWRWKQSWCHNKTKCVIRTQTISKKVLPVM